MILFKIYFVFCQAGYLKLGDGLRMHCSSILASLMRKDIFVRKKHGELFYQQSDSIKLIWGIVLVIEWKVLNKKYWNSGVLHRGWFLTERLGLSHRDYSQIFGSRAFHRNLHFLTAIWAWSTARRMLQFKDNVFIKKECHSRRNVTQIRMSLKIECLSK